MDTFLSTLIQTTGGLIALLLAAVAAYFIFLQGKAAEYDDQIAAERVVIRNDLSRMQVAWPSTLVWFLPPEFRERFSAHNGNSKGVALAEKLAASVIFSSPNLDATYSDVAKHDTFGKTHLQGRVFILALDEALGVITERFQLGSTSFRSGDPEPRGGQLAAFPSSASGPGFDEWRRDFDSISTTARFLQPYSDAALQDFDAFQIGRLGKVGGAALSKLASDGSRVFFENIVLVRSSVLKIDELESSKSRYLFNQRVHARSLFFLVALASLVGIVCPLLILAYQPVVLSRICANAILVSSLALTFSALLQFGFDIAQPLREDKSLYLKDRWLRPIATDLQSARAGLAAGSTVQLESVTSFLVSTSAKEVPDELTKRLAKAVELEKIYNSSVDEMNRMVLSKLSRDPGLMSFLKSAQQANSVSHTVLHPADFLDLQIFNQRIAAASGPSQLVLGIETLYAWGSRTECSLIASEKLKANLLSRLAQFQGQIAANAKADQYRRDRDALRASLDELIQRVDQITDDERSK